jgi:hypothetical protein
MRPDCGHYAATRMICAQLISSSSYEQLTEGLAGTGRGPTRYDGLETGSEICVGHGPYWCNSRQ